jgi:hypothetical protein
MPAVQLPPHNIDVHPAVPLSPECWLNHLPPFGLPWNCYHALKRELGFKHTVGEVAEKYGSDYTQIKGIGRVYAVELALVLAVFYDVLRGTTP